METNDSNMATIKLEEPGSTRDSFSSSSQLGLADRLNNNKSDDDVDNRCMLLSVVVLALMSVTAIILAAVALKNNDDTTSVNMSGSSDFQGSSSGVSPDAQVIRVGGEAFTDDGRKIYTVAIGHDWGAHNYFDREGYITGFTRDMVTAVCKAAGIECKTVWDKWSNCWDSSAGEHSVGGQGLMDGWYDGCSGWAISVNRIQVFSFGIPYLIPETDHFFVKKGADFNPKNVTGKKIGILDGWITDEKCLARQDITGSEVPVNLITHYNQVVDAAAALLSGEVDVLLGDKQTFRQWLDSDEMEPKGEFDCVLGGGTIMTRKDSDLVSLWNEGFQKLQNSGTFTRLCEKANADHGSQGEIRCV